MSKNEKKAEQMINFYLDDDLVNRPTPRGFKRFTSAEALLQYLDRKPNAHINAISLDNDLGTNNLEGYDLVKELVKRHTQVNYYLIHTTNIIARQNIASYLKQAMICQEIPLAPIKIIDLTSRDKHERDYEEYK